jgi:hypothetical protein
MSVIAIVISVTVIVLVVHLINGLVIVPVSQTYSRITI